MKKLPGMSPFYERFPDVAKRETRVIRLLEPDGGLPAGGYAFSELYCTDPACDCRRVLLQVWPEYPPGSVLATINYGWESIAFYARWLHGNRKGAREIRAASLDPLNPQSALAPALLRLFREVVLADQAYVVRLGIHYAMFKQSQHGPRPGVGKPTGKA